jgi:hypothetical protein
MKAVSRRCVTSRAQRVIIRNRPDERAAVADACDALSSAIAWR